MEDNPDVGTEVAEVMLICPVIWFMLFIPLVLVAMDTLMFMLLLYMLVLACCPKCGGDCCENMLQQGMEKAMCQNAEATEKLFKIYLKLEFVYTVIYSNFKGKTSFQLH